MKSGCGLITILAHIGIESDEATGTLAAPIHFSIAYQYPGFGKSAGFDYTRAKNLAHVTPEETLVVTEKADCALITSSGINAIVLAFEIFPAGAKVVAAHDLYSSSFHWFNDKEKEGCFSLEHTNTEAEFLAATSGDTDTVYIETPTNPPMVESDIEKAANAAHAKGTRLTADNTFCSPVCRNPIPSGADIVVHSATEYLTGHNDVLADVMITNDKRAYDKLLYSLNTIGPTSSPSGSHTLMRGLEALELRMEKSTENARDIIAFSEKLPVVKEVLYMGKGGMVSFRVVDESKIPNIINSPSIIILVEGLDGMESLITYPRTQTHADIPGEARLFYGLTDDLLRLSIGIEGVEDLIDGLKRALEV